MDNIETFSQGFIDRNGGIHIDHYFVMLLPQNSETEQNKQDNYVRYRDYPDIQSL